MLRPVIGAIDATLEELSLVLERRDWTGAQAALAELERIEQSLSQDYRHSARQRAMRASVVRALDLAQQGDLEMAFFVIDDATLEPDDVTDAVRQAMAQALEMERCAARSTASTSASKACCGGTATVTVLDSVKPVLD